MLETVGMTPFLTLLDFYWQTLHIFNIILLGEENVFVYLFIDLINRIATCKKFKSPHKVFILEDLCTD